MSRDLPKLGYKGVESCELNFADGAGAEPTRCSAASEGRGFAQMMRASRSAASRSPRGPSESPGPRFDDALRYAQQRESFGQPIWQHQSIGNLPRRHGHPSRLPLAGSLIYAAQRVDFGQRADMEAGMAKLFASEAAMEIAISTPCGSMGDTAIRRNSTSSATFVMPR